MPILNQSQMLRIETVFSVLSADLGYCNWNAHFDESSSAYFSGMYSKKKQPSTALGDATFKLQPYVRCVQ